MNDLETCREQILSEDTRDFISNPLRTPLFNELLKKDPCIQDAGLGYKKIAEDLGISVNTVKSFCRRQRLKMYDAFCLQCGSPIQQPPRVRKKKFCSDKCRSKWWNRHPEQLQRQTMQHLTCVWCGRAFERYGKPNQQYCSRACCADARRKEAHDA